MMFCCPVCGGGLERREHAAVCGNGHSFDVARQGYVHVLPPNRMHSALPGDSREMVEGRRRFLEAGYYQPFRDELCRLVREYAEKTAEVKPEETSGIVERASGPRPVGAGIKIVDAGCGEGYYTGALKEALSGARVCGFDISKLAVKAAAGRYKAVEFAVASCFSIPLPEGSCDVLTNVFAPMASGEFARVLKPGGYFLYAVPGERHLFGLKEILYEKPYENERKDTEYEGFRFVSRTRISGNIRIPDAATAADLFAMTPYYWKTGVDGSARLRETHGFSTETVFDFLVYQRT